jgi:hypothetical protein
MQRRVVRRGAMLRGLGRGHWPWRGLDSCQPRDKPRDRRRRRACARVHLDVDPARLGAVQTLRVEAKGAPLAARPG